MTSLVMILTLWNQIYKGGFLRPSYVVSFKVSLKHFVEHLENEQRVNCAQGSMTSALLHYDLSIQGPRYIHEHRDAPGFFSEMVHQLSNKLLCVHINLNRQGTHKKGKTLWSSCSKGNSCDTENGLKRHEKRASLKIVLEITIFDFV